MSAPRPKLNPMLRDETSCPHMQPSARDVPLKRSPIWVFRLRDRRESLELSDQIDKHRLGGCSSDVAADGSGARAAIVPSFGRRNFKMYGLEIICGQTLVICLGKYACRCY